MWSAALVSRWFSSLLFPQSISLCFVTWDHSSVLVASSVLKSYFLFSMRGLSSFSHKQCQPDLAVLRFWNIADASCLKQSCYSLLLSDSLVFGKDWTILAFVWKNLAHRRTARCRSCLDSSSQFPISLLYSMEFFLQSSLCCLNRQEVGMGPRGPADLFFRQSFLASDDWWELSDSKDSLCSLFADFLLGDGGGSGLETWPGAYADREWFQTSSWLASWYNFLWALSNWASDHRSRHWNFWGTLESSTDASFRYLLATQNL